MNAELFRRAGELFDQLRDVPEGEAGARLEAITDGPLRQAVRELLRADREAAGTGFLNQRALADAAALLRPDAGEAARPGDVIAGYRVVRRIGMGGMGVVYLAEDMRLQRRVALKVLTASVGGNDTEREQLFQREVRAAGLLSHPHIVALYDAGSWEGHYYLAMEYVEGVTVRELLAGYPRGLEESRILDLVGQVAGALTAAHEAGMVHRDIKPENLMVRPDGLVKVLDLGMAKLREPVVGGATMFQTRAGGLAGTTHYLSPEQVSGKPVDGRSDVFSLGVVAYELATGQRPFEGPTDGAVFDAILNVPPALPSALRPELSEAMDGMVMLALEKDPELRFQTAADLRSSCRRGAQASSWRANAVRRHTVRERPDPGWGVWVTGVGLLAALCSGMWWMSSGERGLQPVAFERLTEPQGEEVQPSVAADGRQFVYASAADGKWNVYLQRTGGSAAILLTGGLDGDATQPAFSPDASRIAFRSEADGGGIFVMEATGENPQRLTREGYFPSWSPDGTRIVYATQSFANPAMRGAPTGRLRIVDVPGGGVRDLKTGDAMQPVWSPDGKRIAYWGMSAGGQRDLFTVAADGSGAAVAVTQDAALDWNPVWVGNSSTLYFLSNRGGTMNVWRVGLDADSGRVRGAPEPVTMPTPHVAGLSASGSGKLLLYVAARQETKLYRVGLDVERERVVGTLQGVATELKSISNFSFSPDGKRVVFGTMADSTENLWIMNADGTGRRRVTNGAYRDRSPMWSPVGDEITFYSDRSGQYETWLIRQDGSGLRKLTEFVRPSVQIGIWSPDAKQLLVGTNANRAIVLDPERMEPVREARAAAGLEQVVDFLPQDWLGRTVSGTLRQEAVFYEGNQVKRTGEEAWVVRLVKGSGGRWAVLARSGELLLYDRKLGQASALLDVKPYRIHDLYVAPDARSVYLTQVEQEGDLWMAQMPPGSAR